MDFAAGGFYAFKAYTPAALFAGNSGQDYSRHGQRGPDRLIRLIAAGAAALAAIACSSWIDAAAADGDQDVRVGVYENAPKIYLDEQGEPAGLFVRLIREIADEEGWTLRFVRCEWHACLKQLGEARIDLMPDVAFTEARDQRFDFHDVPVAHSWSVILTRADATTTDLTEMDRRRIAVLAGAVQRGPLATILEGLGLSYTLISYPSYREAFEAVRDRRADAVATNSFYASRFAHDYNLRETPYVFNPVALYFAAPPGDPSGLLPAIDANLAHWRYDQDSVYYQALQAAMVPAQEPVVPPMLRDALVAAAVLLMVFLAVSALLRWQVHRRTAKLRETGQRLDRLLHSSPVVLYHLLFDGERVTTHWVSDNMERLFGFTVADFIKKDRWPRQLHPDDRDAVLGNIAALPDRGHLVQEYRIIDAGGGTRTVRDEMQYLPGPGGAGDEIVGSWNDLTEARAQAEQASFLAHYDPLTRLSNRALLRERLTQSIYQARREDRSLAVLYIDLDRFKNINDSLGRGVGDSVLREVAKRLAGLVGPGENLARIGGDGFVVLMDEEAGRYRAETLTRTIMGRFVEPIRIGRQDVAVTLSIGISLFPGAGDDADTLLQNAEAAMYEAKRAGRNTHHVYTSSLSVGAAERLSIESALRSAVANGELVLHYQLQVELASRRSVGVEALVRWQHPELGELAPGRFIPIAEEMGIVGEIGAWVLEEACRQMTAWRSQGIVVPRVAVNLSAPQVDSETLIPLVRRILERTGLDPSSLELEVTESIIMREPEKSAAALSGLRNMGIRIAVDDFGTGYSSLSYLKHLPIDRLKIDRSFVRDVDSDLNSQAISRAIIGLANSLELDAVAEGIEEERQLAFLLAEGCPVGQGFLFGRPVPASGLADAWRRASGQASEA